MVQFSFKRLISSSGSINTGILSHIQKEFQKNINHKGLQHPFCVHPPHQQDLGDVSIHIPGCSWNFLNISFGGGLGHAKVCLMAIRRSSHQNYITPIKISFSCLCNLGPLRAISRAPFSRSWRGRPCRKGDGRDILLQYSTYGVYPHMPGPLPPLIADVICASPQTYCK